MKLKMYQIDAFADRPFSGNPAAVCPLDGWLPDELLQAIAAENNLSETAYLVPDGEGYRIRWFTPVCEVKLCGHATLASAYVLYECIGVARESIRFESLSGPLTVTRQAGGWLEMDFPAQPAKACDPPEAIVDAFRLAPAEVLRSEDYIVVLADERAVETAAPDMAALRGLDLRGVAITAPASRYDFVTRFFAPKFGIDEDPVTGSAFTQLVPYWVKVLGKTRLQARQVSPRGGEVRCVLAGDRVRISGRAVKYLEGTIEF